jgi:hypothetical protein
MATGVFPHGPSPAMQRELQRRGQVIESLAGALLRLRWAVNYETFGTDYDAERAFWGRVWTGKCVVCGEGRGETSNDLDAMFCSKHCIVCNGHEALMEDA